MQELIEKYNFIKEEITSKSIYTISLHYNTIGTPDFTSTVSIDKKEEALKEAERFLNRYNQLSKEKDWMKVDKMEDEFKKELKEHFFLRHPELTEDSNLKEAVEKQLDRGFGYTENIENAMGRVLYQLWKKNNIKSVEIDDLSIYEMYKKNGTFVQVRPCAEEYDKKTYVGIYLGDMPQSVSGKYDEDKFKIKYSMRNPYIYIPETNTFVWGSGSWWSEIKSMEDLGEISDSDIENVWYMKVLSEQLKENNHS